MIICSYNKQYQWIYITPTDLKLIMWQDWVMWKYKGLTASVDAEAEHQQLKLHICFESSIKYSQLVCSIKSRQTRKRNEQGKWVKIASALFLCHWDKSTTCGRERWGTNSPSFPLLPAYMAVCLYRFFDSQHQLFGGCWRLQGKGEGPCPQLLMCFLLCKVLVLSLFPEIKLLYNN